MSNKEYLTDLEIEIIKQCLTAVYKTIKRSSYTNSYGTQEYYVDTDKFNYSLLSDMAVKTLKRLAENY